MSACERYTVLFTHQTQAVANPTASRKEQQIVTCVLESAVLYQCMLHGGCKPRMLEEPTRPLRPSGSLCGRIQALAQTALCDT